MREGLEPGQLSPRAGVILLRSVRDVKDISRALFRGKGLRSRVRRVFVEKNLMEDVNLSSVVLLLASLVGKTVWVRCSGGLWRHISNREKIQTFWTVVFSMLKAVELTISGLVLLVVFAFKPPRDRARRITADGDEIIYLRSEIGRPAFGGSLSHWKGIALGLEKNGIRVHQLVTQNFRGIVATSHEVVVPSGIQAFPPHEIFRLAKSIEFYRKVIHQPNLNEVGGMVYQRYSLLDVSGMLLARKLNIPYILEFNASEVWIEENWGSGLTFPRFSAWVEDLLLKNADFVSVVSENLARTLVNKDLASSDSILVVPNGVNLEAFDPRRFSKTAIDAKRKSMNLDANNPVFMYVGSFGKWHGTEHLLRAFAHAQEKNQLESQAGAVGDLVFIGDGDLFQRTRQLASDLGVHKFCHFYGPVGHEEVPLLLQIADVLVNSTLENADGSNFFGSPTKLFEYCASGKLVITSNAGGLDQLFPSRFFFSEHQDSPMMVGSGLPSAFAYDAGSFKALASAITNASADFSLRQELGIRARELAELEMSWEQRASALIAGFRSQQAEES